MTTNASLAAPQGSEITWYSPSALALLLANLVPLYGVLYLNWSVLALMVLLWLEVILVALFTVLRMLCAAPANRKLWLGKAIFVPLFGLFAAATAFGVGIMMYWVFGKLEGIFPMEESTFLTAETARVIRKHGLLPAFWALLASHSFSFFSNYLGRFEFRRARLPALVEKFFGRVTIMGVALWCASWFMSGVISSPGGVTHFSPNPAWAMVAIVIVKICLDLRAHVKEHRPAHGDSGTHILQRLMRPRKVTGAEDAPPVPRHDQSQ